MFHDMFVYKSGLRYVCAPNMSLCFTIVCVKFFSLDLFGYQASVIGDWLVPALERSVCDMFHDMFVHQSGHRRFHDMFAGTAPKMK